MKRLVSIVLAASASLAAAFVPSKASAGGFYLMDRGVRAGGRGGVLVAGADDPASLYYNPAGLAYSGRQLLFDAALPLMFADYTRIDSGGNTLQNVELSQVYLPIPSVVYTDNFGLEKVTFGAGIWAPNAVLSIWPGSVMVNGTQQPAPQRYSLIDLKGSLITNVGVGMSFRPIEQLSIGATVGFVTGSFAATTTMSACDGAICTQPENPEYDSLTQFNLPFFIAPMVSIGAIGDFGKVRVGASFDTPFTIRGQSDLTVRVPSAAIFENSTVSTSNGRPPTADVNIPFAWILRTGVEVRPLRDLRLEAGFEIQGWKRQDQITLDANDVYINDVLAVGDYQVGNVTIPRNMRNTYSVRGGAEYRIGVLTLRGGLQYETGAFTSKWLQALTLDSNKVIISGGIGLEVARGIFLDGVLSYSMMTDMKVRDSAVPQPNPIRPEASSQTFIGNGDYHMSALLIGGGLRVNFDTRRAARAASQAEASQPASPTTEPAPAAAPEPAPAPAAAPAPEPTPAPATTTSGSRGSSTRSSGSRTRRPANSGSATP